MEPVDETTNTNVLPDIELKTAIISSEPLSPQSINKKEEVVGMLHDTPAETTPIPTTTSDTSLDINPISIPVNEVPPLDINPIPKPIPVVVSTLMISKLNAINCVKVNPAIVVLISCIQREPLFFDTELLHLLGEIVKDGVINTADVPKLMTLFQRMYTLVSVPFSPIKVNNVSELCLDIVHLILEVLLAEKLVPTLTPELVVLIGDVLRSCVAMASHIQVRLPKKLLQKFYCC